MVLVIDGYNVLKKLLGTVYANESQRDQFIKRLCRYAHKKDHTINIVFDGGISLWPETFSPSTKMKVVYVGKSKSADDYIKDYLEEHKSYEIALVSSDRELNLFAAQRSITSIDSRVFLNLLEHALDQNIAIKKTSPQPFYKTTDTKDKEVDELMASLNISRDLKKEEDEIKPSHKQKVVSKKERFLLEKLKKL